MLREKDSTMASARPLEVVCGIIERDGLFLAAQRAAQGHNGGLWELPGGKIEAGELPDAALVRELREELGVEVEVRAPLQRIVHHYSWGTIALSALYCRIVSGEPYAHEHQALRWIGPAQIPLLSWAPADIPLLSLYQATAAPA
jgi:8-oxo-dGTP diphosphatase